MFPKLLNGSIVTCNCCLVLLRCGGQLQLQLHSIGRWLFINLYSAIIKAIRSNFTFSNSIPLLNLNTKQSRISATKVPWHWHWVEVWVACFTEEKVSCLWSILYKWCWVRIICTLFILTEGFAVMSGGRVELTKESFLKFFSISFFCSDENWKAKGQRRMSKLLAVNFA